MKMAITTIFGIFNGTHRFTRIEIPQLTFFRMIFFSKVQNPKPFFPTVIVPEIKNLKILLLQNSNTVQKEL